MKDIIWTLIILWLVFKVVSLLKELSQKKSTPLNNSDSQATNSAINRTDLKSALRKRVEKEGEYVDFEEVK